MQRPGHTANHTSKQQMHDNAWFCKQRESAQHGGNVRMRLHRADSENTGTSHVRTEARETDLQNESANLEPNPWP